MHDFQFDIAFSFHSLDEPLAVQLSDLFQDRFKTFLYSKHQDKLAGTDGEATFNAVFGQESRLVVVLCRKEWGETPFTRFEMTAIRNRGFQEGYDFSFFIPTDEPPTVPKWLPKNRLYYGLKRFGINGAAGAIEARVQEAGGEARPESVADRAARMAREAAALSEAKRFRQSPDGTSAADNAFTSLIEALRSGVTSIAPLIGQSQLQQVFGEQNFYLLSIGKCRTTILWRRRYSNDLAESALTVEFYDGMPDIGYSTWEKSRKLKSLTFDYVLFRTGTHGYERNGHDRRQFSPSDLGEHILKLSMDYSDKIKRD